MGDYYFLSYRSIRRTKFLICFLILSCAAGLQAQKSISGFITDQSNLPLVGVNISVSGKNIGAVTDIDGRFDFQNVQTGDILLITYIGYVEQFLTITDENNYQVTMQDNNAMLNEVVVVGYGTTSRRNVTGSVSKVDMKNTETLPNTNVSQALRGRVAGVQFTDNGRPGQGGSILVRGPRSLSAGNNPLIVLDGIFFNGTIAEINPNDIESMEILKDASAAAIYGSRAANGVILITSKRGVSEKPTININAFAGVSDWVNRMKLLSPERYIEKSQEIRRIRDMPFDPNDPNSFLTITEAENFRNGQTVDPYDEVAQQGRIFSLDVSLAGKSKNTNYYLSGAMTRENGLVLNDNLNRMTFRVNLENKVTDWLKIGTNTMFSEIDQTGVPASINLAARQSPFGTWYRPDGTPTQFTVPEDQGASPNPLRESYLANNLYKRNNLFSNFYAIFSVPQIKGLSFRVNYSHNYRWIRDYIASGNDPYLPNDNISYASKRNWQASDWVLENILDYKFQLSDDHIFDVTLMYGSNENNIETTTARADRLEFEDFGWNRLNVGELQTVSSSAERVTGISSMARLNYRFKERYLLTLTARRDGSSVFAANNKFATFPSASIGWIASDESFLKNVNAINFLKFRISYGAVGNQAISPYQSLSLASITQYVFGENTALGIYPTNIPNENLKWETTYSTNLAVDFELFKSRVNGTIELYNMNTRDLLVERTIPIMTGYSSIWTNLGEVNNRGIEITLNTVNVRNRSFEWSSNFVFSHNQNKIVSLYGADADGDGIEDNDIGNSWFIGQPMNSFYDYVFDGIYQIGDELPAGYQAGFARFKDLNGDGMLDAANDRTIVGYGGQPKFRWGIGNNFKYKNFELSIFINAMQGWIGVFNDLDFNNNSLDPTRPANVLDSGWWTPENQSNTRPMLDYRRTILGHNWYLSRDFIRVQDVSLSYRVPTEYLNRRKISHLTFFISGKNLMTFTEWLGPNPESVTTERYPIAKSATLGFRVGF